jgi:hypothetical protein
MASGINASAKPARNDHTNNFAMHTKPIKLRLAIAVAKFAIPKDASLLMY